MPGDGERGRDVEIKNVIIEAWQGNEFQSAVNSSISYS